MAARKKAKVRSSARRSEPAKGSKTKRKSNTAENRILYVGCFFFDDYLNDKEYTGTFQMILAAATPEQAVEGFGNACGRSIASGRF